MVNEELMHPIVQCAVIVQVVGVQIMAHLEVEKTGGRWTVRSIGGAVPRAPVRFSNPIAAYKFAREMSTHRRRAEDACSAEIAEANEVKTHSVQTPTCQGHKLG